VLFGESPYVPPKRPLTFTRIHRLISQRAEMFIVTEVVISNTTVENIYLINGNAIGTSKIFVKENKIKTHD
jgi:hypothetical protein